MVLLGKEKSRKGFTLSEMLAAVAIVATVLSFAVPAIIGGFRRMNLNGLDDSARSIFLAAQNSMTAMVGNGEFEDFAKKIVIDASGAETKEDVAGKLPGTGSDPTIPSDFPRDKNDASKYDTSHGEPTDLRYLDSANDAHAEELKKLLPGGSIDKELAGHRYVVEYNCKTGAVYAVWYSDKEGFDGTDGLSYAEFVGEDREQDTRLKAEGGYGNILIGYYGGSGVDYALVGQMPIPELTLTNAEELRLHIKIPGNAPSTELNGKIGLEVTITGEDSGVSKKIIQRTTLGGALLNEGCEADIMLDTLRTDYVPTDYTRPTGNWTVGMPFHKWNEDTTTPTIPDDGKLIPGEDISVTVTTYYVDTDKLYLPQSVTVTCNSLFASVEKKEDPAISGTVIPTAMIAYGRHLQNLDAFTATGKAGGQIGVGESGAGVTPKGAAITAAEQIAPIDFKAVNGTVTEDSSGNKTFTHGKASDDIYFWTHTYEKVDLGTGNIAELKRFTAIYNNALKSYNGNSLPIRNMEVEQNQAAGDANLLPSGVPTAGLFAHINSAKLDSIILINTSIDAENNTGALAGLASNTDIVNCQVYLEKQYDPTKAETPLIKTTAGGSNTGGLIGRIQGGTVTITDSFAATIVNGGGYGIGGLVGEVSSGTNLSIDRSYAACYLTGNKYVGGLVGYAEGGTSVINISNSYSAGVIAKVNILAGGIAGNVSNAAGDTVKNSYAAVRYSKELVKDIVNKNNDTDPANDITVYGAAPVVTAGGASSFDKVYFIPQTGVKYADNSGTKVTSTQLSEMDDTTSINKLDGEWYNLPAEELEGLDIKNQNPSYSVFPYHQVEETKTLAVNSPYYPYPMLKDEKDKDVEGNPLPMFHYGDWLEDYGPSLCYFEDYGTGVTPRYGVWGYENGKSIDQPISNLKSGDPKPDDPGIDEGEANIVADGYGLLVRENAAGKTKCPGEIEVMGGTLMPVKENPANTNSKFKMIENVYSYNDATTHEEYVYDLYPYTFVPDAAAVTPATQYYHSIILFGQEYWFNFDYACEAVKAPVDATTGKVEDIENAKPQAKPRAAGFAADASVVPTGDKPYEGEVIIRTARQLANMAAATESTYTTSDPAQEAAQQRAYVQLMDIDYNVYTGKVEGDCLVVDTNRDGKIDTADDMATGFKTGKDDVNRQLPAALDSTGLTGGSYNGNDFIIKNLYIDAGTDGTGLFGCTKGTLSNIRLVNVSIKNGDHQLVGALAGDYLGTSITNCGVYVDANENYDTFSIEGKSKVGGLIGEINSTAMLTNCFAAVKVSGADGNVGGLIGKIMQNSTLNNCYSGGHTDGGEYKESNVIGEDAVGGLIGQISGSVTVNLTGINYSTCSVGANSNIGLLIGNVAGTVSTPTEPDKVYAIGVAFDKDGNSITPREETYLTSPTENPQTNFATYPYDKTLFEQDGTGTPDLTKPLRYPYTTNLSSHHGDWVEKKNSVEACFYWEKEGSDYKVYIVGFDTASATAEPLKDTITGVNDISTLCKMHHTVGDAMGANATSNGTSDWGYGTIGLADGLGTGTFPSSVTKDPSARGDVITALQKALDVYSFEDSVVTVYTGATESVPVTVKSKIINPSTGSEYNYNLNLGFGAAISLEDGALGSSAPYQIRNVQQLDNIPNSSPSAFQQSHDVYGNNYSGYIGADGFAGTYNGQSYRILELGKTTTTGTLMTGGLFNSLDSGTGTDVKLNNIILYSPSGSVEIGRTGTGNLSTGVLANSSNGTVNVENCVVAGYSVINSCSNSSHAAVGGLIGSVIGGQTSIKYCTAVITLSYNGVTADEHSASVGGLVGEVKDNYLLSIENSYAGGKLANGYEPVASCGGILGSCGTNSSVHYTNVYSYMDMTNSTVQVLMYYGIGPCGNMLSTPYTNCHYLQGCFPTNVSSWGDSGSVNSDDYTNLQSCMNTTAPNFGTATISYVPTGKSAGGTNSADGKTPQINNFPFPAVVQVNGQYVHYGEWPGSAYGGKGAPAIPGGPEIFDEYYCICTIHCVEDAANPACPVCAKNPEACAIPAPDDSEPAPTETAPTEAAPTEAAPTGPAPTEAAPTGPTPTEPVPSEAVPTEPVPSEAAPTEAAPTEPAPTESAPTGSTPTEPVPSEAAPIESAPTEAAPTGPALTEPVSAEPTPIEPTPTEPVGNALSGEASEGDEPSESVPNENDPAAGDGEGTISPTSLPPDPSEVVSGLENSDPGTDTPQEGGDD